MSVVTFPVCSFVLKRRVRINWCKDSHGNVFHKGAAALVGSGALLGHAAHARVVAAEVDMSIVANGLRSAHAVALENGYIFREFMTFMIF